MNRIHKVLSTLHLLRKKHTEPKVSMGLFLVLALFLMVGALTFYGFLFTRYQGEIDEVLPTEKTLAYITLEDFSLPSKLSALPELREAALIEKLKAFTGLELPSPLPSFLKGPYGLALIRTEEGKQHWVFIGGVRSKRQAVNYFQSQLLEGETLEAMKGTGKTLYTFPQGKAMAFTIINATIYLSDSTAPLETLIASRKTEGQSLKDDPVYQKSVSNLPRSGWGYAFLNFKAIAFPQGDPASAILKPLKTMMNHVAWSVRKDHSGFLVNQYLNLNENYLSLNHTADDRTKFTYDFSALLHGDTTAFYVGGENLAAEWQNTLETIAQLNPSYALILEAALRAQMEKIFGRNVDLRNDLYPLFEGEYAFGIGPSKDDRLAVKLLLAHHDKEFIQVKMEKLMQGFRLLAAEFTPRIEVFTLPDGTETRELFADPDSLKETTETYDDTEISCTEVLDSPYGFCYAITENLLIMANKMSEVKSSLDLRGAKGYSLADNQSFRQPLSNLSKVSDEIGYLNAPAISSLFKASPWAAFIEPILSPFESATWVKHYFDDGMSAEGYILLK
jgi:hypothetical protein